MFLMLYCFFDEIIWLILVSVLFVGIIIALIYIDMDFMADAHIFIWYVYVDANILGPGHFIRVYFPS